MMRVYLGLGTNLGNRKKNLEDAIERIRDVIGPVKKKSSVYETEPWGFKARSNFYNIVIEVRTELRPSGLLGRLLMIEAHMGRIREGKEYKSRIIDIDILLIDNRVMNTKVLQIPHPGLQDRKFALAPLCEIAPELIHPFLNKSMKNLLKECTDETRVKKLYNKPLSAKL